MTGPRLAARIAALESETEQAFKNIEAAEKELARSIAEDGNRDAAHAKLTKARDIAAGSVAALRRLDVEYFETATAEYEDGIEKYNSDLNREFQRIGAESEKALKPLEKALSGVFPDPAVTLGAILDGLLQRVWLGLQDAYSSRRSEMIPAPPAPLVPRNERGVKLTAREIDGAYLANGGGQHFGSTPSHPGAPVSTFDYRAAM